MNAPRVLFVAHAHPAFVAGGTELLAHDLFRAWRAAGREGAFVGAVTRLHREPRSMSALQAVGPDRPDEFLIHVGGFDSLALTQREPTAFVHGFGQLLARVSPDVVHFHHFSQIGIDTLMMVRRLAPEARIVVTLHDYHLICAQDGLMKTTAGALCSQASPDACHACFADVPASRFALRRQHLANLLGLVDAFVAPSRFIKDRHVAWGLPEGRIEVIGNAVPEAPLSSDAATPETPHRFGVFANLAPHKGVLLAIDAASRVATDTPFELQVHGANLYREPGFTAALDTALAAAGPRVVAGGAYARAEIGTFMAGVDWVVVPSTWWENAPLVILEAFRHRKPVITADIGGMAEMVRDGVEGLRFRAGNPADLARVMQRAARDAALWTRLRDQLPVPPTPHDLAEAHLDLYARVGARGTALSA